MPRKKPFSGKQKKEQLKSKRERKEKAEQFHNDRGDNKGDEEETKILSKDKGGEDCRVALSFFESRPVGRGRQEVGRYALVFRAESKEEIARLKEEARKTIYPVQEEYLECKIEDFYNSDLDFPTRPPWNFNLTVEQLESNEKRYFMDYLKAIDSKFEKSQLSYFELNLETWRQFWRVLEMSDILLCIVDIRYPPLLFPPKLYDYACKQLGKHIILILNKIDLAPAPLVLAWKDYFKEKYPELDILCFTSFPSYNLQRNEYAQKMKARKVKGRQRMAAEGAYEIFKTCEKYVGDQVDLSQWKAKILEEMNEDSKHDDEAPAVEIGSIENTKPDTGYVEFKKFNGGILTIGCLGQPNVGKSSLINALMGKKVVSVSRTPGHTKHFQTIHLTQTVRLCDCPGLIFPSQVPKSLQVLCGSYPIATLREPYSTVKYLAERLDLPKILGITHPDGDTEWSAFDICDGWALKRGYFTAKASRPDSYRGANHILRLALDGRICLCLRPPNYLREKEKWASDPRIAEIEYIQAKSKAEGNEQDKPQVFISDEDISEEEEEENGSENKREDGGNEDGEQDEETDDDDEDDDDNGNSDSAEADEEDEEETQVIKKKTGNKAQGGKFNLQNKFALLNDDD